MIFGFIVRLMFARFLLIRLKSCVSCAVCVFTQLYKSVMRNSGTFQVPGKEDCTLGLPRRLELPGNEICEQ
jgi:hypothetical protein